MAEDCPAAKGETPKPKGDARTIVQMQYDMLARKIAKGPPDNVEKAFLVSAGKD